MRFFLETKQQTQATTIENLRLETGWKFNALLIKETECINQNFMLNQSFNIVDDNDKNFLSS